MPFSNFGFISRLPSHHIRRKKRGTGFGNLQTLNRLDGATACHTCALHTTTCFFLINALKVFGPILYPQMILYVILTKRRAPGFHGATKSGGGGEQVAAGEQTKSVLHGKGRALILWMAGTAAAFGQAQAPSEITVNGVHMKGVPTDWSHRHVVFSNPGTEADAIKRGTHDRWLKIVNDPVT